MMQLDLFAPPRRGDKSGHLFDVEVDGWMWRAMYRAPGEWDAYSERMVLYRGKIHEDGTYKGISGCHMANMPYSYLNDEVISNIRLCCAYIDAGKTDYGTAVLEDALDTANAITMGEQ
jgi:hypothetical protein